MSEETLWKEIEHLKFELERQKAVNEIQQVMAHYEAVHLNPAYIARSIECFADWRDDISADVSDWGCFFGYDAVKGFCSKDRVHFVQVDSFTLRIGNGGAEVFQHIVDGLQFLRVPAADLVSEDQFVRGRREQHKRSLCQAKQDLLQHHLVWTKDCSL